ncbi:MAG TPA: DJ-1/PfpI family protein, partial [Actinomycetota bacterium]|nr:DJ-1/PfpI family protein [Actinomycetota bacterium]
MRIGLVVQDGCFASGVSSLLDVLGAAESARATIDASIAPLDVVVAGPSGRVRTSSGMTVTATRRLGELGELDVVVVPAVHTSSGADTEAVLESSGGRRVVKALRGVDLDGVRVAAACTGVFFLAEAGLVEARRVTTTWFLTPTFRARYPETTVDLDAMVVADGPVLTAGAAFAHIDLALALVRAVSVELAHSVARQLLIDERPSQAAFVALDHLQHDDPI